MTDYNSRASLTSMEKGCRARAASIEPLFNARLFSRRSRGHLEASKWVRVVAS